MKNKSWTLTFLLGFITLFISIQNLQADIINLNDGKKMYGQFIALTQNSVFIETIIKSERSLQTIALPRNRVSTITDETGTMLFSDNDTRVQNILIYENVIRNNWEELKEKYKYSSRDSLFLLTGEKLAGKLISITEDALFWEKNDHQDNEKNQVAKYALKQIKRINGDAVIFVDPSKPVANALKKTKYPVYSIQIGFAGINSGLGKLQGLFQEYYNSQLYQYSAKKRLDMYFGIQMDFDMLINEYLAMSLTAHYFDYPKINQPGLIIAEAKYIFHQIPLRPAIALGVAGQDFSSSEKVADKTYTLRSSKSTVSFGIILDSGSELGYGFSLGAHYLPFGKFKIKIGEANEVLPKKVDFSMIMIALGLRFNFN
ncbi:MAG: hypothetical protein KDF60_15040 [Calditrichaeota bacterium]|nr:hypothetical protein [Calditrichota bacterium]